MSSTSNAAHKLDIPALIGGVVSGSLVTFIVGMIFFVWWKRRRQDRQRVAVGYVHPTLDSPREAESGDAEDIPPPSTLWVPKPRPRAISSIIEIMGDDLDVTAETSSSMRVDLGRENSRHVLHRSPTSKPNNSKEPPPEDVAQSSSQSVDLGDNNDIIEETEQRDSVADSEIITFLVHQDSGMRAPVRSNTVVQAPSIPWRREVVVELPPEYSPE